MLNNDTSNPSEAQIKAVLAEELDGVAPQRDLWPSVQAEVRRQQQRRRWRWLDFLGLVVVVGSPASAAVRLASVALGSTVVAMLAWLLLSQPWMSNPNLLARHAGDYWYDSGELVAVNGASSYDAFFQSNIVNPVIDTHDNNFCRFGLDVDTVSYTAAWQLVKDGRLPDPDSVRVEGFINRFAQGFQPPVDDPFAIQIEGAPAPFGGEGRWLIRVSLQGRLTNAGESRVIAKNVEAPVEFNPAVVSTYRQVGYEYRRIGGDHLPTDAMVASEVSAGLAVTALYELQFREGAEGRVATAHIKYEDPDTGDATELTLDIYRSEFSTALEQASPRFQRDAAVAEYAEILHESYWAQDSSLEQVRVLAQRVSTLLPDDPDVAEFLDLVTRAEAIATMNDA